MQRRTFRSEIQKREPSQESSPTEAGLSRRRFVKRYGLAAGATGLLSSLPLRRSLATTSTPTLNLYLAIWQNPGGVRIPWTHHNPRVVAERACYLFWRYIRLQGGWLGTLFSDGGTVVGHATLFAEMRHDHGGQEFLVFSNYDKKDAGMYFRFYHPKNPYRWIDFIMAVMWVEELLAGHTESGVWQSLRAYKERVDRRLPGRVVRRSFTGDRATEMINRLRLIYQRTHSRNTVGAPRNFGLNTLRVRPVDDAGNWGRAQPMTRHEIDGTQHEIHGGCANAVASVLRAAGLADMVPEEAEFELQLELSRFSETVLPILGRSDAWNRNGEPESSYLTEALEELPNTWGSGDWIRFVDPNYWHDRIPVNNHHLSAFRNSVENCFDADNPWAARGSY